MKVLTGIAIVNDSVGKRIAYTYSEITEEGTITSSNQKESFIVMDEDMKTIITQLEEKINLRLV